MHCGPNATFPIISTFSYFVDNTRGMMREYPFIAVNAHSPNEYYDISFLPGVFNQEYPDPLVLSSYDLMETSNCLFYGEYHPTLSCDPLDPQLYGGIIDYTPFVSNDDDDCYDGGLNIYYTSEVINTSSDVWYQGGYANIPLPPKTIIHSKFPRGYFGNLAGYKKVNIGSGSGHNFQLQRYVPFSQAIIHNYRIDRNIDLTVVNPIDGYIFNPSEVLISADSLIFPSGYTFKTIRALYPYEYQVDAANIAENGGPYIDKTLVPVETDLYADFHVTDYTAQDHRHASIYRLLAGSKLTIEPCCHIFDATFESQPGSEIIFENWPTNLNHDRFIIDPKGGKITKRQSEWLFQNHNEVLEILRYESEQFIEAGENVDANSTAGEYNIQSGANVEFAANEYIDLEPGFYAEEGSDFLATIDNIVIPGCVQRKGRPKNEISTMEERKETTEEIIYFECSPNPVSDVSTLMFKLNENSKVSLIVFDSFGRLVDEIGREKSLPKGAYSNKYNTEKLSAGIYYVKLVTSNGEKTLRFIKQ